MYDKCHILDTNQLQQAFQGVKTAFANTYDIFMTKSLYVFVKFAFEKEKTLNKLYCIAFTHNNIPIDQIGMFHVDDEQYQKRFEQIKEQCILQEFLFLSTCNRVEFLITTEETVNQSFLHRFFKYFAPHFTQEENNFAVENALIFAEDKAIKHLFEVASSIDSLVVGEREIITQVRNAYDKCNRLNLTGEVIRLAVQQAIVTAKEVYTNTQVANKPVSIVSLAYRNLIESSIKSSARFIIVGAGQTNTLMAKFLKKHAFGTFAVFNRTLSKAQKLAEELNGKAYALNELGNYNEGFDVLISCTGASENIVTEDIYNSLLAGDKNQKVIIDLSVPNDIAPEVKSNYNVKFIDIQFLQNVANKNLAERKKELHLCHQIIEEKIADFKLIHKERQVELAMKHVPKKVKEIKENALQTVFAKDIENLDEEAKAVLNKVLNYVEKKYISVPMKLAKEIMLN
ncbi:MAG TPA: glutamyl-tRNA reductase [Bacteroidia bacterium]|nr:glutamyl-tRNA reductase [Bacteroidia bacterium]